MDLHVLELLVDVAAQGSFAAVARERGIVPSSVSRTIAGLEQELGVRLLQRSTRTLSMTDAGRAYVERVGPLLEQLRAAAEIAKDSGAAPRGRLRVTAPTSFAQVTLVPMLPGFAARHPELELELLLSDRMHDLVTERIDVAVRLGNIDDSSLVGVRLGPFEYVACASPAYVARRGLPRAPAELAGHDCLRYPIPGVAPTWRFRRRKRRHSDEVIEVEISGRFVIDNGLALRTLALAGLGVAVVPRHYVREHLRDGSLVALLDAYEVTGSRFDQAIWSLLPSRSYLPGRSRVFVEFLRELCRPDA